MKNLFKRFFGPGQKENIREPVLSDEEAAQVAFVAEKSGWSREEAAAQMKAAKDSFGIPYEAFAELELYHVPAAQRWGTYRRDLNHREARAEQRQRCITETTMKRNCTPEEAVRYLDEAREKWDIGYSDYLRYDLAGAEDPEKVWFEIQAEKARKKEERAARKREERASVVKRVMEKTGWDRKTTAEKIRQASQRTGCSYEEYLLYQFYDLDEKTQDEIFLTELSHKLAVKYVADRELGRMLCDKAATNLYFSDCLKRPWCLSQKTSFAEFQEKFSGCQKIVYKPLDGNWGRGVVGFEVRDNLREIYDEISAWPEGVVEQFVIQHPKMRELSPTAVNTVRFGTLSSTVIPVTEDGEKMAVAYASLKIGGVTSDIVDNLHGGGMVAGVDMETGILVTDGVDNQGNVYAIHPVTGTKIKGFEIPYFREAVEMVTRAVREKGLNGYLGWDVAIGENGPELIEVNQLPGAILVSMPYIPEKKGMKPVMEKYL